MALKDLLSKLVGGGPPPPPDDLGREAERLVEALVVESRDASRSWQTEIHEYPSAKAILDGTPELQARALPVVLERLLENDGVPATDYLKRHVLKQLARSLLRRNLPYGERELVLLIESASRSNEWSAWTLPMATLVGAVERFLGDARPSPALAAALKKLDALLARVDTAEQRKQRKRIARVLAGPEAVVEIRDAGLWTGSILKELEDPAKREAWIRLLQHGADVESASPSRKWLDRAGELVAAIGADEFRTRTASWLARGPIPGATTRVQATERDAAYLRSLVWAATTVADPEITRAIGELADACFKKVPQLGAVSNKVGNACVWALGRLEAADAVAHLSRLKARVKYANAQRLIAKALDEAAARAGMSAAELEEAALPSYGMDADGVVRRDLGEWRAEIAIAGERAELGWVKGTRRVKSTPAEVKRDHPDEVKALQKLAKEITATVQAQRVRLERLDTWRRSWSVATWRERYVAHPLLAAVARNLVWEVSTGSARALVLDGRDADGNEVPLERFQRVRLFHPLGADEATLRAWRKRLAAESRTQPFKQIDRETFAASEEEKAAVRCARFAGRTLKQHQLQALCRERGWRYSLQGGFDSANQPTLELEDPKLRVLWDVEPVDDAQEMSDMAIYLYVRTLDLVFQMPVGDTLVEARLGDVPPLVFSEILRDVDLFVSSAAVA